MTIAIFTHNAKREGAPRSLLALAKNLHAHGHSCIVFSPTEGPLRRQYEELHIPFFVVPSCFDAPLSAEVLRTHLKEKHVDTAIINTITGFRLVPYLRSLLPHTKVLWIIRESEKEYYFRKLPGICQKHFDLAHHVIFVAHATKERYAEFDKGQFCVIHNAVDTEAIDAYKTSHAKMALRQKYRLPPDGEIISCIGTITPRKGQAEFIESALHALGKRPNRKTAFVLVGKIPNEAAQRYINNALQKAEWMGVREAFFLFDETADVFDFFRLSDVFVCNAFIESFPRVVLEAMAFELPIIATKIYGIPEQIQHMRHGLLTFPGNATMLTQQILALLELPGLARTLAHRAYKRAQEEFSEEKMTRAFEDLLRPAPVTGLSRDKSSRKPAVLFLSGASGDTLRYRVSHQAESLRLQGWYVETLPAEALEESHAEAFSFFILHRVSYSHEVAYFIRKAQALGKIVIFDIDDLLFGETHFSQMHRLLFSRKSSKEWEKDHARHYGKVLSLCNAATVTTRALQQSIQARFPHAPAFVMKNTVSAEMRGHAHKAICEQCDTRTKNITIGYFSGTPTHDVDFLSCAKSLQSILEEDSSVRLRICGYLQIPDFLEHLHAQIEHIPFVPWQQVSAIIASTSINLAPLECGNSFAEAKSELKYLEAAIVGVPTVASATDAFRSAIIHGKNGFLCSSDDQWQASLRSLIRDSDLRKSIGENAKKDVLKRYTTEVRGEELADLLMQISTQKHSYALSSACVA